MNILILGIAFGLLLGLVMIFTFVLPALRERKRKRARQDSVVTGGEGIRENQHLVHAVAMSREEIWNRGCHGESLSDAETQEFNYLARARFHTFQMGVNHAGKNEQKSSLLIKGLAVELINAPGLERLWYESPVSDDPPGKAVNEQIADLQRKPSN